MKMLMIRVTSKISGAEVYNFNLIKGFERYSDFKIIFLTNHKVFKDKINSLGLVAEIIKTPVNEIGTKRNFLKAFLLSPNLIYIYLKKIKELEKNGRFDLICFQSMTEKIFLTSILKLFSYKVIWIEHGPLFKTSRAKIIKIFFVLVSKLVNKIITVSKDTEVDLIKGGVNKKKIKTLYIGIDTDFFKPLDGKFISSKKKELGIKLNDKIIGFLGTVCKEKGIKEFMKIAKEIVNKNKNIKFLVLGDGSLLKWSKNQVKKCSIEDNFIFLGQVVEVRNCLGLLDVLLFPTKHKEGISISLLESMSMGVSVFANDIGGNREIINNKINGYLLNFSDYKEKELGDKLMDILKNENIKEKISKNARASMKNNFDINKNINNFYNLFKSV